MTHGSLFSGIGGFDLAASWMGWDNVFHCEKNQFGQKILRHYWPKAISYEDITATNFTIHKGAIDVLSGGFPCQPFSVSGKRKGTSDDRHLWPEMLRAIREIRPQWVVGENVRGLLNINGGLVFEQVCVDLEAYDYEVLPFLLPACGVNAPHRRERIFIIAHTDSDGYGEYNRFKQDRKKEAEDKSHENKREWVRDEFGRNDAEEITSNSSPFRMEGRGPNRQQVAQLRAKEGLFGSNYAADYWKNFPTESPVCGRNDGLPPGLDGITFSKHRNESLKAYGNAVMPQVAYQVFKMVESIINEN